MREIGTLVCWATLEDINIVEHGNSYGVHGNYEYLELWKNSVRPYLRVKLDGKTEITLK